MHSSEGRAAGVTGAVTVGHHRGRALAILAANPASAEGITSSLEHAFYASLASRAGRRCRYEVGCAMVAISIGRDPVSPGLPRQSRRTRPVSPLFYPESTSPCISAVPSFRCGLSLRWTAVVPCTCSAREYYFISVSSVGIRALSAGCTTGAMSAHNGLDGSGGLHGRQAIQFC